MRPDTLRRLLVFGVYLLGAAGLYVVAGGAGTPSTWSSDERAEDPEPPAVTPLPGAGEP
jgi:hypothetical protein